MNYIRNHCFIDKNVKFFPHRNSVVRSVTGLLYEAKSYPNQKLDFALHLVVPSEYNVYFIYFIFFASKCKGEKKKNETHLKTSARYGFTSHGAILLGEKTDKTQKIGK